jgi:maltose alpha-D-glucosyltransferase/alpha-amylase
VRPYFGDGDEFQLGFHFPAMPRIFKSLRAGDGSSLVDILKRTPDIPEVCQWCTFLRNHDELTLEMVTEEERQWMWREYAPESRMRLNLGIRRRLAPLLDNDRRKLALAHSLLFTLPGSPFMYYGDEIGMGDNIWLDDRNGVRTPMQWDATPNAGFSKAQPDKFYLPLIQGAEYSPQQVNVAAQQADPASQLNLIKRFITVRKQHAALGEGRLEWVETNENPAILAFYRIAPAETLLAVHNLSGTKQGVDLAVTGAGRFEDVFGGKQVTAERGLHLELEPYAYQWLKKII